jgi:hypothetical protein
MRRLGLAAFSFLLLVPASASADAASAKRADDLFRQAMEAQEKGRYEEACAKLEESNRLERAVGTEYNLAACYEVVKRTATARRLYLGVAELATKTGKTSTAKKARDRAEKLDRMVPRLTLRAAPSAKGATITLDGKNVEASAIGAPMEVDPGRHAIVAKAEGRVSFETNVDVGEGQRTEVVIALDPTEKRAPTTTTMPPASSTPSSEGADPGPPVLLYAGFAAAGLGVVSLGVAGFFTLSASSAKDESGCRDGRFCPDQASADRLRDAQSDGNLATVFAVTGGVLVVAGAALVVLAPRGRVAVSPRGMGLALSGTF